MKIEKYRENSVSFKSRLMQKVWAVVCLLFFRLASSNLLNFWRIALLKLFGATIGKGSIVYSSVFIPAPWNLTMGQYSCLGPQVKLHIDKTILGDKVTISQGTYLCSGTHDITSLNKPFTSAPIIIQDFAWVAAECFVGPGVTIEKGAVVGARSAVFKDVKEWTVVGGNPAKFLKTREISN